MATLLRIPKGTQTFFGMLQIRNEFLVNIDTMVYITYGQKEKELQENAYSPNSCEEVKIKIPAHTWYIFFGIPIATEKVKWHWLTVYFVGMDKEYQEVVKNLTGRDVLEDGKIFK